MTDTNQKLREALQVAEAALSDIGDADREPGDDLAWCERRAAQSLPLIRQALALPTSDHIPDAGEMVVDHFPDAGKMIETAAPVGERLTLSAEDVHAAFVKHFPKTRISQAWIGFAAEIANAVAARAALSAGDAVDAQRYRWLREQHWSNSAICCVYKPKQNVRLGGTCPSGDLLDSAIDAAMRKGQL